MTDPDHHAMMEEHASYGRRIQELEAEVERLQYEIKGHLTAWDIEHAEVERLQDEINTCRELREYDRKKIEQLRAEIELVSK